jgi:hypothetical protein
MFPAHAELQSKATSALDAIVNSKNLCLPVKSSASEALNDAEATIKTIDHPFDGSVRLTFVDVPEADFVSLKTPSSLQRLKMFYVDPPQIADSVDTCP